MCTSKKITVKVTKFNNVEFPTGCQKDICCDMVIEGDYWKTPVLDKKGLLNGYTYSSATLSKPTPDSYKVVKLNSQGYQVEAVIADGQTSAILKEACAVCCGDTPIEFTATIPAPIIEIWPCENSAAKRLVSIPFPSTTPLTLVATFGMVAATPAPSTTFANPAALKTWVSANWGAYGTFTHDTVNQILTLELASGVNSAGISIT